MSVFIGYPSFMAYQMMKGKKGNNEGFPSIPGIVARYSAPGLTNEQMAANPVWKDLTGNGHDLQMKNFAWKGMSGVNGYVQNFNNFKNNATVDKVRIDEQSSNSIKVTILTTGISNAIYIPKNIYQFNKPYSIKISSEGYNEGDLSFYASSVSTATTVKVPLNPNGITEIPAIKEDDFLAVYLNVGGKVGLITIEQLPLYPGALVFDGVDDYGVCDNFPILTKEKGYTVVALRKWLTPENKTNDEVLVANLKKPKLEAEAWGAFGCEIKYNNTNPKIARTLSFGSMPVINVNENNVLLCQTSNNYNGVDIANGNDTGGPHLLICSGGRILFANAAIWELVFLDHDATEEELTKIKDYFVKIYPWLFPDQAWTVVGKTNEDEDRATIANITGNGNDLVLSNFGFAEGSGYGLYAQNYISYAITNRAVYTKTNSSIHVTKSITAGVNFTESARGVTIPSYRIKVTGIQSGQEMIYRGSNNTFLTNIPSDGIYVLPVVENGSNLGFQFVSYTGDCDITIEQIPEYEGYLVTDGVDDKIQSSAFTVGKDWTTVGEWEFLKEGAIKMAGIAKFGSFRFYNYSSAGRMDVYINAELGTNVVGNSIKAVTSKGSVYLDFNSLQKVTPGDKVDLGQMLMIGHNGKNYTKMAFKNFAIYPTVLSEDDCIKAYNYLQTLKAK